MVAFRGRLPARCFIGRNALFFRADAQRISLCSATLHLKRNPMNKRRSVRIVILVMLSTTVLTPKSVFGRAVRPREEFGTIQSIDIGTRRLTVNPAGEAKPLTLIWNSQTRFLQDWGFTNVERLKQGTQVTVYYRSPFFGERFATKIVWTTSAPLSGAKEQTYRAVVPRGKNPFAK